MQQKKEHHFVPIVYLKHFCKDGKLYALNLDPIIKGYKAYPKLLSPSQVCFINDFYTIFDGFRKRNPLYSNYDALHTEDETFKELENAYGKFLHQKLTRERILATQDALLVCDFILQMKIRNPYHRDNDIKNNFPNMLEDAVKLVEGDKELISRYSSIPEIFKKVIIDYVANDYKKDINFASHMQLFSLLHRDENKRETSIVKKSMMKKKWILLISPPNGSYFITTDNPGMSIDLVTKLNYNTRFTGAFKFYFPLSNRYCLLIDGLEDDKSFLKRRRTKVIEPMQITSNEVYSVNDNLILKMNSKAIGYNKEYLDKLAEININKKHPNTH